MDSGSYAACTALVARTQQLDAIANNLANASTVGYRAQHVVFSSVLADAGGDGSSLDQAINHYGIVSGTSLDMSQGALQKTGNELDAAISGSGYFVVQTANGDVYTRNGSFQVSGNNELVTQAGDPVLGDGGSPIRMAPGRVSISSDGTISTNGAVTGKLHIVEFPPSTKLTTLGNTYYSAPPNTAQDSQSSDIRQGFLESSNVNPILGMVELVTAQRSAEMMQRALAMFNTEIDKTATQDLPKVS